VTAQLINVADGYHLWSETYDRQMADIFDIQDDVAGAITDALQLHLTPHSDRPTQNTEAYALYLEALASLIDGSGPGAILLSEELLDRAIALDPQFAKAYELKATVYWNQSGWLLDAPTGQKLTYEAAMTALELDPTLIGARSYASTAHPDWNWIMEIDALEELIEKDPKHVNAMSDLSYDLVIAGYFDDAVRITERIIELEPLAQIGYWRNGEALLAAGRRSEGRASFERAAELGSSASMWVQGTDSLIHGDDETAIYWFERQYKANGLDPDEIRPLIENVRNPDLGKAFLDQWVESELASASTLEERLAPYSWYLSFGYIDDYWLGLEILDGGTAPGWSNADNLEHSGMTFRQTGYAAHPKYLYWAKRSSLIDLWDHRGPPDHCRKESSEWVCE
jgi:tetratricopeptide (TPR) repeat protein